MTSARLLEGMVVTWLTQSPMGIEIMREAGTSLNETVDNVFELLNAGILKITRDRDKFNIEPCMPPRRPIERVSRPSKSRLA